MGMIKIISLPVDNGGCGNYRVRQPLEMIKRFTDNDCHIIDKEEDDMLMVAKAVSKADVMLVRQGGEVGMPYFKGKPEYRHLKWVMDIDDNMEIISPYSEHYREYGTEEFKHHGEWLWQDGQNGFDLKANRLKIQSLLNALRAVDMVTVTTDKLAEYALQYNKNVRVLPNLINFERWWQLPLKPNQQMRVGWSGGMSHYEDWEVIKKPLNQLLKKYQFKLVMVGTNFEGIVDPENRHLVEYHDWCPFKGHSYRMMCMNLDLAIIPLADLPFNHYKSAVKFYEMSAMGVPCIISDVPPYSSEIKGRAWGYKTPEEFKSLFLGALAGRLNLKEMGKTAYDWVFDQRNAKKSIGLWVDAYQSLL
jgi:glycosyltransferase involved in cell wall biosynthesis